MFRPNLVLIATGVAMLCSALVIPVTGASASAGSIKAAIKSETPTILVDEGHLLTALGEYKTSRNPAAVQAALTATIASVHSLESKIAAQPAVHPRVKRAKAKLEKGLQAIVVAYERLNTAFGEKTVSPEAAKAEVTKALRAVKKGGKELTQGMKLLR
jgi:hypothetical protein